jgi:hypothetical protein
MANPDFAMAIFGKVAWRLLPLHGLCYFTALFDRKNVGMAVLANEKGWCRQRTHLAPLGFLVSNPQRT